MIRQQAFSFFIKNIFILGFIFVLVACGGGGSSNNNNPPPNVQILFPPPVALSNGASIKVRGTAIDSSSTITNLTIGGVNATSTDNYATWTAEVPLAIGANTLHITTTNSSGKIIDNPTYVRVQRDNDIENAHIPNANNTFLNPETIAYDANNNRVFVNDSANGISTIDLNTGERSLFGETYRRNTRYGLAIDTKHNRLLGVRNDNDYFSATTVAFDLKNQAFTFVNQCSWSVNTKGIALTDNNRLLMTDITNNNIVSASLDVSNECSILSQVDSPIDVAIDKPRNRALVLSHGSNSIYAVDLNTGISSLLSNNETQNTAPINLPIGIVIDSKNNRALITSSNSIYSINLENGVREIISSPTIPNSNTLFGYLSGITLDPSTNYALVLDGPMQAVYAVDIITGERVIFSK